MGKDVSKLNFKWHYKKVICLLKETFFVKALLAHSTLITRFNTKVVCTPGTIKMNLSLVVIIKKVFPQKPHQLSQQNVTGSLYHCQLMVHNVFQLNKVKSICDLWLCARM